jgi:hypothetical protein
MVTLPAGKIKYIHVNQHVIKSNTKNKVSEPVITVKCGKENHYGNSIQVEKGEFIYNSEKPILSCGARLVFKTRDKVVIN